MMLETMECPCCAGSGKIEAAALRVRPSCRAIIQASCEHFGVSRSALLAGGKANPMPRIRRAIVAIAMEAGYTAGEIGYYMGRDPSAVLWMRRENEKRIDPYFVADVNQIRIKVIQLAMNDRASK